MKKEEFSNQIENVLFVVFHGVHYTIGDHVITIEEGHEMDPLNALGHSTYKAKITMFSILVLLCQIFLTSNKLYCEFIQCEVLC